MRKIALSASLLAASFLPLNAFAASCDNYPGAIGAKVTPQENGPKIVSTYQVSVPFDDADEMMDAYAEARAEAKAQISDFLETKISKECKRKSAKFSESVMSKDASGNEAKSVNIEKSKLTLCNSLEQTEAILNGVVDVGRCYTPGKFVKVTIGIKPETINSASSLQRNMKSSRDLNRNSNSSGRDSSSGRNNSSGFNPVDGYSSFDNDF